MISNSIMRYFIPLAFLALGIVEATERRVFRHGEKISAQLKADAMTCGMCEYMTDTWYYSSLEHKTIGEWYDISRSGAKKNPFKTVMNKKTGERDLIARDKFSGTKFSQSRLKFVKDKGESSINNSFGSPEGACKGDQCNCEEVEPEEDEDGRTDPYFYEVGNPHCVYYQHQRCVELNFCANEFVLEDGKCYEDDEESCALCKYGATQAWTEDSSGSQLDQMVKYYHLPYSSGQAYVDKISLIKKRQVLAALGAEMGVHMGHSKAGNAASKVQWKTAEEFCKHLNCCRSN